MATKGASLHRSDPLPMASLANASEPTMPLVLLPGTLCDARLFDPLRALLPARETGIGDLQGCASMAELAARLLATAPPRFALLGFSLGALLALEIAAQAPARLAGLALIGGNGHAVAPDLAAQRRAAAAAAAAAGPIDHHVGTILWPSYVADPADEALRRTIVAMAAACPPDALALQTELAVSRADSLARADRLKALTVPVLILAGAQDAINPPAAQHRLAAAFSAARLVLVPAAGHFVLLEQAEACARAVAGWLAQVDHRAQPHAPAPFQPRSPAYTPD